MARPSPVSSSERLESLDVLRGFALLGILAMNIRAMAAPFAAYMYPYAMFDYTGWNRAAYIFTSVVFDLKMMGLFSMLFGGGVLLYAGKGTTTGKPPRGLWFRRMFWLLLIGLVHAYLIWDGDILVPYALCGILFVWWARRLPAWALATAAVLMLAIGAALSVMHGLTWDSTPEDTRNAELEMYMPTPAQVQEAVGAMHGGYLEVVTERAPGTFMIQSIYFLFFFLWRCGGMMLLGMALLKWGFLDGRRSAATYARAAVVCIPLGLTLAGWGVVELERVRYAMPERTIPDIWNYVGAVFASVGYAAALLLLLEYDLVRSLRGRLASVGQMALSNYLLQSTIASIIFLGWGFDFVGRADYAGQLLVCAAIWLFQLAVSPWWLARYRFGPAEWVWRSLTYWHRQPMRGDTRRPTPAAV
ncbi:MAG TPA: DUF418 domain-containing protein [Vicinamibacterales bacterium]|jgi:uncharacterized protein|nr:DUF418 domain-containing protein [Vicinamibacterales bacterium]